MRKIILSLFVSMTFIGNGQIPFIESLEATPIPLSDNDSILFIATVGMNNTPVSIDYITISDSGSYIIVDACYAGGMFDAFDTRTDTFNLGIKPPGVYDLILYARGYWCDSAWSSTDTITIAIGNSSIQELATERVVIYPNPVSEGIIKIGSELEKGFKYSLYDQLGRKVSEGLVPESYEIVVENLQGTYFLLLESDKRIYSHRIQIE